VKSERKEPTPTGPPLEEGQVWTLKDKCLEIRRVGKYLVEFLITQTENGPHHPKKGKRLESIQVVQKFLQSHQAILSHR
jgi:hypothetical protein